MKITESDGLFPDSLGHPRSQERGLLESFRAGVTRVSAEQQLSVCKECAA